MNEGDRALEARRDATLRRLRHQANRSRFVQRTGRERPTLKPITFLCAFSHDVRCPRQNSLPAATDRANANVSTTQRG